MPEENATPFSAAPAEPVATPAVIPTPAIVIPDALAHLVGEGKKYATMDLAVASIAPAQEHLTKVESENAELRIVNEKARSQEDILADMKRSAQEQTLAQPAPGLSTPAVDPNALSIEVNRQMDAREVKAVAVANAQSVVDAMTLKYGDKAKAEAAYIAKASELGLGLKGLNDLSGQSPEAAFTLLGLGKQERLDPEQAKPSTLNTEALNQSPTEVKLPSVMGGSSSKQVIDAWRASAPKEG